VDQPIVRRDLRVGVALLGATSAEAAAAQKDRPGDYPPLPHGLPGSHPGSFEAAHCLRDGTFWI
jgi:spermidine dehydrogenase